MERTHITIKGDVHQKSTEQASKGEDTAMEITTQGYESREFQARGNRGVEKPKYSGPLAEDVLHGPCRIHYAYLDGKRVSNHQMKDCRTFLRLQSAMDSNQV
jgi:hypothetical protein